MYLADFLSLLTIISSILMFHGFLESVKESLEMRQSVLKHMSQANAVYEINRLMVEDREDEDLNIEYIKYHTMQTFNYSGELKEEFDSKRFNLSHQFSY